MTLAVTYPHWDESRKCLASRNSGLSLKREVIMKTQMGHERKKLSPIHPGEILSEEFLLPMDITQYRLAKAIGVDARRIHSIVHGERSITAETALLFSRFFGNSAEFWMGLQSQYDLEVTEDRLSQRLENVAPCPTAEMDRAVARRDS